MTLLALALVFYSVKGDLHWSDRKSAGAAAGEQEARWAAAWRKQQILSPALIIALAFLLSLLGFDLVMSLDPRWYSTLFGGYFFIGCFYTGIVALYLLSMLVAGYGELQIVSAAAPASRPGQTGYGVLHIYRVSVLCAVSDHLVRQPARRDAIRDPACEAHPMGTAGLGNSHHDISRTAFFLSEQAREGEKDSGDRHLSRDPGRDVAGAVYPRGAVPLEAG